MLIVSQSGAKVYNLNRYDAIAVSDCHVVLERDGKQYGIGRYDSEETAQSVLDNLLEDFSRSSALPFEESANPYWLPGDAEEAVKRLKEIFVGREPEGTADGFDPSIE